MKTTLTVLFVLLYCLGKGSTAHADRDIVYAARYYAPPGSHGTSHFHLYRINPDGTGKTQITFGDTDDHNPVWSPDGKQILFVRDGHGACLIGANGGTVRLIQAGPPSDTDGWGLGRWLPDGKTISVGHTHLLKHGAVSEVIEIDTRTGQKRRIAGASEEFVAPDGKHTYLPDDTGGRMQDRRTGVFAPVSEVLQGVAWADNRTLIGLGSDPNTGRYSLRTIGTDGQQKRQAELRFSSEYAGTGDDDPAERGGAVVLGPKGMLVFALNNHNSTVGTDNLFFRLPRDGAVMSYITEGQFLAWSPDGSRFCTAPGRDTTDYEKRPAALAGDLGEYRQVWYAPLFVRAAKGGPMRQITPRLSWVVGADWRRGGHSAAGR